jgi:hypothetical protein
LPIHGLGRERFNGSSGTVSKSGKAKNAELEQITLRFSGQAAQLVRERNWHASQQIQELADGNLELSLTLNSLEEITSNSETSLRSPRPNLDAFVAYTEPEGRRRSCLGTLEDALPQCARASAETEDSTTRVQLRGVKRKVCKPCF